MNQAPGKPRKLLDRLRAKGERKPPGKPGKPGRPRPSAPRSGRQKLLVVLKWGAVAGFALFAIGAASLALLFWIYGRDPNLPSPSQLKDLHPPQVSRVLAADGTVVGEIFTERRTVVPFAKIPKFVDQAFISAEDANFYQHEGIDYTGMLRAFFVNLRSGEKKQGASTITQQVVKNLLLSRERSLKRKVQEIILARRLEHTLSKDEILSLYLNQIYFGHGRYGVEEAARFYFGKGVAEVDVGEAALLAGLPKGPELYSPKKPENRERAKDRQVYVLNQMAAHGYLSRVEAQKWIDAPIHIVGDPFPALGTAPEWVELAKRELVKQVGETALDKAGATITTTLDLKVQALARTALQKGLRDYDQRKKYGVAVDHLAADQIAPELAKLGRALPKGGPKPGADYRAVVEHVYDDGEVVVDLGGLKGSIALGGPGDARYNPDGKKPAERFSAGDVLRVTVPKEPGAAPARSPRRLELTTGPEGAVVVIDPRTRKVLALVGGYDQKIGDFDRATQAHRQAGSTFKPFVYAAAIDSGEFTAASIVNDAPEVYDLWKPENHEKGKFEGPVRLRYALARSINTVAIKTCYDIGPERVAHMAHAMGVEAKLPETLSIALGSGEVTPLELTNAFVTFATGGIAAPPQLIAAIGGQPVVAPAGVQALRPEVAYVVLDMMRSVVQEGTGSRANKLKLDIAGKTGTSNDTKDAWFIGMSTDYVVGVWIGFDDFARELGAGEQGGRTSVPVFVDIMGEIGKHSGHFLRPAGVVEAKIDKTTGLLAADAAPDGTFYTEVFLPGTVPVDTAPAPGEVDSSTDVQSQYDDAYDDPPADQPAPTPDGKSAAKATPKPAPKPSAKAAPKPAAQAGSKP